MSGLAFARRAEADPKGFRDPDSVAALLDLALSEDLELRGAGINALAQVVKALEDEPVEASVAAIAEATPALVSGLTLHAHNIDGCTISVLRRIPPSEAAVPVLVALLPEAPDLVLEALGQREWEAWPAEIEALFADSLALAPRSAGYQLYCGARHIRRTQTLDALLRAASEERPRDGRYYAVLCLCVLTGTAHEGQATARLRELLDHASPRTRREMAEALGWASNGAESVLARLRRDEEPEVRQAAEEATERRATA